MATRNFPYLKFRLKNRGAPRRDSKSGQARKIPNTDYLQSIPQLLAYTGCTRLRDEETGKLFNFERKDHLIYHHVAVPKNCDWATDRERFGNAIMRKEKHPRARLGRDVIGVRPDGMSVNSFIGACSGYAESISIRFNTAVYIDLHNAHKQNPDRPASDHNVHAHFFFPSREVTPEGFGRKLRELDLKTRSSEIIEELRAEWARCLDHAFGIQGENEIKMEHRSYARQGLKKQPQPKLGTAAHAMNQRGDSTERQELFERVQQDNRELEIPDPEELSLRKEIARLEEIKNTPLPKKVTWSETVDDHQKQRKFDAIYANGQRTQSWLKKEFADEPSLGSLMDDFSLLLAGPRPEEEKIPNLPMKPTVGDLAVAIQAYIDQLELRIRPRPQYARQHARKTRNQAVRRERKIDGLER